MSELLNRTIGGYQLLEPIGGGGVAEVYRAHQTTGTAREVAVKVIFPEFARQPGVAANFAQITRAAAQLASHPHILPVISSGEDQEYLYLVTPLVKEGSLADWLEKGGRLGASDVGPFFQQLCGAVSYAHSLGLTHGNIKPSNVYLFEGRHVLLGDFGLLWDVRALDPSWSGSDVAAFEYLAPEVFDGRMAPFSDIYSLGATLFATLTGHAPFQARRLGELIAAARQQTPPNLAQETPPVAPPVVALDTVVRQAMAKQVEQRYPSAAMLGQAIEAVLRQAAQPAQFTPAPPSVAGMAAPPAPAGASASLAQLDPPFPPLPPMAEPEPAMEMSGAGAVAPAAGPVFAAPPAPRVEPAPQPGIEDGPTMRVAAPQPAPPSGVVDAPTMRVPAPSESRFGDSQSDMEFAPAPPSRPARGSQANGTPLPLARIPQVAPELEPGAQSGQFSATELGLPRLTNPAMGDLPPDWRELITDESARRRHDPFSMSDSALAPLPPIEPYENSRDDLDPMAGSRVGPAQSERMMDGWQAPDQQAIGAAGGRGAYADYDIERMASQRSPMRRGAPDGETHDTLQSQKVWTNSRTIVRGKRRSKGPFFTILALLALTALELAGLAVARPDICVTHACSVVAAYAHQLAPGLRIPGVTAPVHLVPVVPQVSVVADSSTQATFTLSNNSEDPITWSATPTLNWMTISPTHGALKGGAGVPLTVTVKPQGIAPGVYTAALSVYVGEGMSQEPVVVTVKPGAELAVTPSTLAFSHCGATQSLSLSNPGGAKLTFTASPSQASALSVTPGEGSLAPGAATTLSVAMSCDAATGATYAVIIVSDGGSAQIGITYS